MEYHLESTVHKPLLNLFTETMLLFRFSALVNTEAESSSVESADR